MSSRIKVGIFYGTYDPMELQLRVWRAVDEAGFDQLWNSDHLVPSLGDPTVPVLDAWSAVSGMALATKRVRIGVLVTNNLLRNPALVAKMAVTADHLSGGRLEVGIGATNPAIEYAMLGFPVAEAPERARRLDEACQVLKALWTQPRSTFHGRFYQLEDAIAEPKALQRPHPPLMVAGRGAKVTLRVAARWADAWNSSGGRGFDADVEAARVLDAHCRAAGRDPASIRRSVQIKWPSVDEGVAIAKRYAAAGFTEFVLTVGDPDPLAGVERLRVEALPHLRAL